MAGINRAIVARIAGVAAVSAATLIAGFEGWSNKVYVDPVGHYAVCAGHDSTDPNGKPLKAGTVYSDDVCSYLLGQDVKTASDAVDALVKVPLSTGERLAYTDFVFNVGRGAFASSSSLRKLNAGDRAGACAGLKLWDKGTVRGKLVTLPGLVKRRQAEYQACMQK